jgi:hypothetical protein
MEYMLSLGVSASYARSKEQLWRRAGVSVSRLRANSAALAEELHLDVKQACSDGRLIVAASFAAATISLAPAWCASGARVQWRAHVGLSGLRIQRPARSKLGSFLTFISDEYACAMFGHQPGLP